MFFAKIKKFHVKLRLGDIMVIKVESMNMCTIVADLNIPFFILSVLRHRVEKIPSVQSLVATSRRPNICGAVMALGFILISLCGIPISVRDFISTFMQQDFPVPLGPRAIIP